AAVVADVERLATDDGLAEAGEQQLPRLLEHVLACAVLRRLQQQSQRWPAHACGRIALGQRLHGQQQQYWRADTGWSAEGNSKGYLKTDLDLDLNVHDQRCIGRPIKIGIQRAGGLISPAGFFPGVRAIRIDSFNFGEERPDPDGTAWKLFPLVRKGAPSNPNDATDDYSRIYGLAFRKTAWCH
uniref:hypothetical protein n=1 Tax=Luteimonas panaciterrae TaxID=363885 RepID=UPI0021F57A80